MALYLGLSGIGVLAFALVYLAQELRRHGIAEQALLASRANVEHEIEARTRELLAARAEAEAANHVKDDLLAVVSHELRTPLNAIVGWTHVLKIDTGENRARAVEAIERNAHAQTHLIDELLDVSRISHGPLGLTYSPIDLRTAVLAACATVASIASAKGVNVIVRADARIPMRGDAARLQQVAWNLVSNAVKFTPKGGIITVDLARDGAQATLRVTDTGGGIDRALLPFVFEPFRQGPAGSPRAGLGLGLALVRHIVEQHGGTVTAESDGRGHGATFTVILPAQQAVDALSSSISTVSTISTGDHLFGRVLVVEDDEDGAETLAAVLHHRGCDVRVARSVADAVAALGEAPPDLLLCDIGLPDGDGCALIRELRQRFPDERVPAIALSARAREGDRQRALDAGFEDYVTKPYEVDQLFERIRRATHGRLV